MDGGPKLVSRADHQGEDSYPAHPACAGRTRTCRRHDRRADHADVLPSRRPRILLLPERRNRPRCVLRPRSERTVFFFPPTTNTVPTKDIDIILTRRTGDDDCGQVTNALLAPIDKKPPKRQGQLCPPPDYATIASNNKKGLPVAIPSPPPDRPGDRQAYGSTGPFSRQGTASLPFIGTGGTAFLCSSASLSRTWGISTL
jgi:hypothetical protein